MTPDVREREIVLFLHIPKTAGTTLRRLLTREYADPACESLAESELWHGILYDRGEGFFDGASDLPEYVVTALRGRDVRAVIGHFSFGIHKFVPSRTTYLAFLREPVARVTSLYFHLRRWRPDSADPRSWYPEEEGRLFTDGTALEEFVCHRLRDLDNGQTRRISGVEPAFGRCTRSMLDTAKRNIEEHFRFVGLTERFDESLVLAGDALGWSSDLWYSPDLVNERRVPVLNISATVWDAILERNELDQALYAFAEERLQAVIDGAGPGFRDRVERLRAATRELGFEPVGLSALTDEASLEDSGLEHDGLAAL